MTCVECAGKLLIDLPTKAFILLKKLVIRGAKDIESPLRIPELIGIWHEAVQ